MAVALLLGCFALVLAAYQSGSSSAVAAKVRTHAMRSDVQSTPGGNASEEYRKKVEELNRLEAQSAEKKGESYIASVTGQVVEDKPEDLEQPEPKIESGPEPEERKTNDAELAALQARIQMMQEKMLMMQQQQQQPRYEAQRQPDRQEEEFTRQYGKQIAQFTAELDLGVAPQQIIMFEGVAYAAGQGTITPTAGASGENAAGAATHSESGLDIAAGDVLYARNEILLNSDVPGPAQATVLAGDFKGAVLLGRFNKFANFLQVQFDRMILPNGEEYKVEGVAIDPEVPASAVRSDVDRHILQRWGGLMGASFLAGFGEAVRDSGSQVVLSDGTSVEVRPELDTEEQFWAAAGRVGEELAAVFEKNFDRPSTVTLEPGINIGILVLSVEKQ